MNVPRHNDEPRLRLLPGPCQELSQRLLVGPTVVAGVAARLHVNDGRMMKIKEDEAHRRRQTGELALHPGNLLAAWHQRRVTVEVKYVDEVPQLHGIPSAASQFGEGIPPVLKTLPLTPALEFVITERRVDSKMLLTPALALRVVHRVVIRLPTLPGYITAQQDGV